MCINMATKMSNKHLYTILLNANKYYTPDIFLALVHISTEIKDKNGNERFLIQVGDDKRNTLIRLLNEHTNINRQTIVHCLEEIEALEILSYVEELSGWELTDMIGMLQEGYTEIRDIMLQEEFSTYKLREKKLLLYMCHLLSTKNANEFRRFQGVDFVINTVKKDSMWRKILRTKSAYYAKYTVSKFLTKVEGKIENISEEKRKVEYKYYNSKQFIFYCNAAVELKKKYDNIEWIKIKYADELDMIKQYAKNFGLTGENLTLNKMYQLAHTLGSITSWIIKEQICTIIMKKYKAIEKHKSREDIKSLPAYAASVIRGFLEDYRRHKDGKEQINNYDNDIEPLAI